MANPQLISSIGFFTGLNTVDDPVRLRTTVVETPEGNKAAYPLVKAVNVDIDNTYGLSSRVGSTKRLSGTDIHSFWANDLLSFFMDGTTLYKLNYGDNVDYTVTELDTGITRAKMSYCQINDRVYMSNGYYIKYYSNYLMNILTVPVDNYKAVLPSGQRIAYHKGSMLVAKERVIYISDSLCDHYDVRTGYRVFENNITMLISVDNGVYVSDGNTWFLSTEEDPLAFKKTYISSLDAILYSDTVIDGLFVGEGIEGKAAIWLTSEGVCVGDNNGKVKIVTPNYLMPSATQGASTIRNIDGIVHYLATIN